MADIPKPQFRSASGALGKVIRAHQAIGAITANHAVRHREAYDAKRNALRQQHELTKELPRADTPL